MLKNFCASTYSPLYYVIGSLSFAYLVLNIGFWSMPLAIVALCKLCLPFASVRSVCDCLMADIYRVTVRFDDFLYQKLLGISVEIHGDYSLQRDGQYLVISNHRSWADVFFIHGALVHQGPINKFLAKAELIYMPLIGLVCWAYDFPMLKRKNKKQAVTDEARQQRDLEIIRTASQNMLRGPFTLVNFAEGTRYTPSKHAQQQSPYMNMLKPKAGGLYTLLQALDGHLSAIIDITLVYEEKSMTFFDLLAGRVPRVCLHIEMLNPEQINMASRATLEAWLSQCWQAKDLKLEAGNS